jgi:hypothetical protein
VKLGRAVGGLRVVTDGLAASDRVIVHGVQKVFFPGMPVTPQTIAMGDPPPAPAPPAGKEMAPPAGKEKEKAPPDGQEQARQNGKEPRS